MTIKKRAQIYPAIDPNNPTQASMLLPESPADGHAVTVYVNGVADDPQYDVTVSGNQVNAELDIIGNRVFADYVVADDIDLVTIFDDELARAREERESQSAGNGDEVNDTEIDDSVPAEEQV